MLAIPIKVRSVFVTLPRDSIVGNKSYVLLRKKINHWSYYIGCTVYSRFKLYTEAFEEAAHTYQML